MDSETPFTLPGHNLWDSMLSRRFIALLVQVVRMAMRRVEEL